MRRRTGFLIFCLTAGAVTGAQAAAITNLSPSPQTVALGPEKQITIPPGETFRIPGTLIVRYGGREVRIDDDQEFAIWKEGEIGPQRRTRSHSRFPFGR